MIRYFIIFLTLMSFYYPKAELDSVISVEKIGISGANVLLFFILFMIFKIYSFHIERLIFKNKMSKKAITYENAIILVLCFLLPIFFISATGFYYHHISDFSYADIFLMFIISYLLVDRDRSLRLLIVTEYEKRIQRWGHTNGVFFTGYPPRTRDDISFNIILILIIVSIVVLIGSIRNS